MPTPASVMAPAPQIDATLFVEREELLTASALLDLSAAARFAATRTSYQPVASTSTSRATFPCSASPLPVENAPAPASEDLTAVILATMTTLLADLARGAPTATLLAHFSTLHEPILQHAPAGCPLRGGIESRMRGLNAVRSYFDLLATHFNFHGMEEDVDIKRVWAEPVRRAAKAQVHARWRWRTRGQSGGRAGRERQDDRRAKESTEEDLSSPSCARQPRGFDEDFELDVVFDEEMKVASFVVTTTGGVCVMDAKYPEGRLVNTTAILRPRKPVVTN
ncbi:uncharacterized protein SCHCODRAFT_02493357 [Schizophyllum commune H4-8]|uniref:Uncharacterized protein n=1 Tax=Schizophyllum commune (strain H4-8 / FGSC 9210) TaxID=578458 RepID=D8PXR7_SCHCM|nr:uncharacterized protein SCHCODRAFT_02493357 [Schizophyllum commune H4-8]KAI5897024.1 hypothetical protein SCHCODRAFT_02493357 [Schizophyllum commune H4-8]